MAARDAPPAPELAVSEWLNTERQITLEALRGRVVAIEAFQMLCPGCIHDGVPQALEIQATFSDKDVAVLGLHTVFEHHDAMTPVSLRAFLHEFRVRFPVGVDRHDGGPLPLTMQAYGLQGTPTLLLIDRRGRLRARHFGRVAGMVVGAEIQHLIDAPA